ncbi:sensor histidine kinase [Nocardia bovistercoris]|uniref:histidine kinase n=1 Tax=Nocardia bovistercoris TaxID=2785916 RepID=A0A931I7W0_9NOCA|nr:histidine kinase [Nocardia bovistercoris]MBH0775485.1 hypothetical protein [Nocardia bovistercoris]
MRHIAADVLDTWLRGLGPRARFTVAALASIAAFAVVLVTLLAATELPEQQALGLAAAQGVALFAATRAPLLGVGVSLTAVAAASLAARTAVWLDPMLNSHFVVLGVAAFRMPVRQVVIAWVATVTLGCVLALYLRPHEWLVQLLLATVVSGLLSTTVVAVRALASTTASLSRQRDAAERQRQRTMHWEERARIARELHDIVAHHMTVIAIRAEAARYRDPDITAHTVAELATIRDSATTALAEMRHVLDVLRNGDSGVMPQPTLDDIAELVESARAAGTRIDLRFHGDTSKTPAGVELSGYRIVQEALSNAIRHAPGAPVRIEITATGEAIRVHVDNPLAPRPVAAAGSGHGLLGIRERVAMLGGTIDVGPSNGKYLVAAILPIPREA